MIYCLDREEDSLGLTWSMLL